VLNKNRRCWICLAGFLPTLISADVYKWIDVQGRPHYADREHEQAKSLSISPQVSYLTVKKVFDGDTILLNNGQKVRLLGINTPEVAGPNKDNEVGGEAAKSWLKQTLEHRKVRLEGDVEKQDKYQRTLAYVFTEDKQHINLALVKQGLAVINIYPPNLKYVDTLLAAQKVAEKAGLGIWGNSAYSPQSYQSITEDGYKGWKRITGRITSVKKTRKYSYLQFSEQVSIRIENRWLNLFPSLQDYIGKNLEARGWINKNRDHYSVQIRHPAELKYIDSDP
jgi:endonuclease YncB( thermonuclease family)